MTKETPAARDEALPELPAYAKPAWFAADAAKEPAPPSAPAPRADYAEAIRRSVEHYKRAAPELHERYEAFFEERHAPPPPRRIAYREPPRRRSNFGRDFFVASCLAAATVSVIGLMLYDRNHGGALSRPLLSAWLEEPAAPPPPSPAKQDNVQVVAKGGESTIAKKPIPTATLQVADAMGTLGAPIPLTLAAEAADPGQDIVIRLSGLPEAAKLSAGRKLKDSSWVLRGSEAKGLQLTLPADAAETTVVTVAAVEPKSGELVAPVQELQVSAGKAPAIAEPVITPAAAAPETQVPKDKKPPLIDRILAVNARPAEAETLMAKGDKLMAAGDFAAARAFYLRALDLGAKDAALKAGETYDPIVFARANVRGLQPDAAKALEYYAKAEASGVDGAAASIAALKGRLGQ